MMISLYPGTEQFRHVIKSVSHRCKKYQDKELPTLNFIGTVKLHGTNTAIGYHNVSGHWCQSRNNIITPQKDHEGFARSVDPLAYEFFTEFVLSQSPAIRQHYEHGRNIVIFGEWCGGNIQKNIALHGLPKMFVIFKIRVCEESVSVTRTPENTIDTNDDGEQNSFWLEPKDWSHIKWHEKFIYNIYDFPTYEIDINFEYPQLAQNQLVKITEAVEHLCPVGKYFNKTGIGEGVVWTEWQQSRGDLKFKVKGEKHSVSKVKTLARVDTEKFRNIQEFVDYACTENRMAQGLDYLREQQLTTEIKNVAVFLRWLVGDINKEEKDTIEASYINPREIWRAVTNKAKLWFQKQLILTTDEISQ